MVDLNNVTLFSVDCKYYEKTILAINECLKNFSFKEVLFLSDKKPTNLPENVKFIKIRSIVSLEDYSAFMINELPDFINTEFCLSVHYDGWIINENNWRSEFLDYDYIGAPWKVNSHFLPQGEKYRVGNGGVSIRSKKLMEAARKIAPNALGYHEDTLIVHTLRAPLEDAGITFAPLELAKYFAYETECTDLNVSFEDVFAFHGKSHTKSHIEKMKYITGVYYRDIVTKFNNTDVIKWLTYEAGSQDPANFFGAVKGNLNLQQIPYEYVNMLDFLRNQKIESYLELGVGNGGSFFTNGLFIGKDCKIFKAVDSIAYADTHIQQTEKKIMNKVNVLAELLPGSEVNFYNKLTDDFFSANNDTFDCIFIDADHSYEGVKKDYDNALKCINKGGVLIFHDIGNTDTGVAELWSEIKGKASRVEEYMWKPDHIEEYFCGIGIYFC
tara:strand:+ start:1442 stop:2764 length:1323 start_codon:yes stop_codon:yes gene_type:complete